MLTTTIKKDLYAKKLCCYLLTGLLSTSEPIKYASLMNCNMGNYIAISNNFGIKFVETSEQMHGYSFFS